MTRIIDEPFEFRGMKSDASVAVANGMFKFHCVVQHSQDIAMHLDDCGDQDPCVGMRPEDAYKIVDLILSKIRELRELKTGT